MMQGKLMPYKLVQNPGSGRIHIANTNWNGATVCHTPSVECIPVVGAMDYNKLCGRCFPATVRAGLVGISEHLHACWTGKRSVSLSRSDFHLSQTPVPTPRAIFEAAFLVGLQVGIDLPAGCHRAKELAGQAFEQWEAHRLCTALDCTPNDLMLSPSEAGTPAAGEAVAS